MKKSIIGALTTFVLIAPTFDASSSILPSGGYLDRYRNSEQRDMCMTSSFDRKVDSIIINDIPSILDQCGIGGMIDVCGMLGRFSGVFGDMLGCGGGGGGGGGRSRFCDWGFNKDSAKEAWRIYRRAGRTGAVELINTEQQYASGDMNREELFDSNQEQDSYVLAQARYKVLGISVE
jgi:hypothetical protein